MTVFCSSYVELGRSFYPVFFIIVLTVLGPCFAFVFLESAHQVKFRGEYFRILTGIVLNS